MCELIGFIRVVAFFVIFSVLFFGVFCVILFCRKNNIDINSFSGMFEMYSRVFRFENKSFSILILSCMYGGAMLVIAIFCITLWAEGQGCIFPTKYS